MTLTGHICLIMRGETKGRPSATSEGINRHALKKES
jgi:hypothetical protein